MLKFQIGNRLHLGMLENTRFFFFGGGGGGVGQPIRLDILGYRAYAGVEPM